VRKKKILIIVSKDERYVYKEYACRIGSVLCGDSSLIDKIIMHNLYIQITNYYSIIHSKKKF